jgi:uncharacterized protein YjiS (DUF1127 family)
MSPHVVLAATQSASARAARANSVLESVRWALRAAMQRMAVAKGQARSMKVLRSLNDDALSDIGLRREQIDYVRHDPRYGTRYVRM